MFTNYINRLSIFAVFFVCFSTSVKAAEITYRCGETNCTIQLVGDIVPGDSDRFVAVVDEIVESDRIAARVSLFSRGGAVDDAIEIGLLVRSALMETVAPDKQILMPFERGTSDAEYRERCPRECSTYFEGYLAGEGYQVSTLEAAAFLSRTSSSPRTYNPDTVCASACALIALAGVKRDGDVGLHHIFSRDDSMDFEAYQRMLVEGNQRVERYLQDLRIPGSVFQTITSTSSDQLAWIDLTENFDYDPVYYEYLNSRCDLLSREEQRMHTELSILQDTGIDVKNPMAPNRSITASERAALESLSSRRSEHFRCLGREVLEARRSAQSAL